MRILYRFGDNDFRATFIPMFELLLKKSENSSIERGKMRDKEYFCALINELAYPLYRALQCHSFPGFDGLRFASEEESRKFYTEYFRATPDRIYIDQEIEGLIEEYGDGNRAWFVLDTQQHDPKWRVYAI